MENQSSNNNDDDQRSVSSEISHIQTEEEKEEAHIHGRQEGEQQQFMFESIDKVKDSINALEKEQLKNGTSWNDTSAAQQQLSMTEMQQEITALKNELKRNQELSNALSTKLEDQLKQKDEQIKALAEDASKAKAEMEMLQQEVILLRKLEKERLKGNVHIGNGICMPPNEWDQWDSWRIQVSGGTAKYFINNRFFAWLTGTGGGVTVQAKNPFPTVIPNYILDQICAMSRIYYFEVTIVNNPWGYCIYVGPCDSDFLSNGFVGNEANSFGICADGALGWIYMEGKSEWNDACKFGQGHGLGVEWNWLRMAASCFLRRMAKSASRHFRCHWTPTKWSYIRLSLCAFKTRRFAQTLAMNRSNTIWRSIQQPIDCIE